MNIKNKIIITILSIFLFFLSLQFNLKAQDYSNAQILADAKIIENQFNNPRAYNLDSNISRREMLKVMLNLSGVNVGNTCEGKFADLKNNDWGCRYAETALKLGYIAPNKNFRPNDIVSKAESLKMIFKAKNIEVVKTQDWRIGYVQKAVEIGYINNFDDYNSGAKRNFVFDIGAKAIFQNTIFNIEEKIKDYQKPKILLTFADNMNKLSVLSNLKIYPKLSYSENWIDDKNLELLIGDLIKEETDVLVNVFDKALTSSGEKLKEPIYKTFKISGEPLVDFVNPHGKITDRNQNITVKFNSPMVSLTNLDNQPKCPIEITPKLFGKCVWITTSTFQFRPENGFPAGAKYTVYIPFGIENLSGNKTINSKRFEIITPEFELINTKKPINLEDELVFVFNDEILVDTFKNNFSISGYDNSNLDITYYKTPSTIEGKYIINKNAISVFPKSGDFGYSKTYNYTISSFMKSMRGNIGIKEIKDSFTTNDFLISAKPFVFIDETAEDKYSVNNFVQSQNDRIITKNSPNILLTFYKEIKLNKSLFSLNKDFSLEYVKVGEYIDGKFISKINKKQVVLSINGNIENNLEITFNSPLPLGEGLGVMDFQTKQNNQILDYKQINYKKSCLTTKNPISFNNLNKKAFEFSDYGIIDYFYEVSSYSKDDDCKYVSGKNTYVLNMRLNPSSNYTLNILSSLIDIDNYPLNKTYNYKFDTPKAMAEDKYISLLDNRSNILVPNSINPLGVAIQSVNLDRVKAEVCQGDFDITKNEFQANKDCKTLEVSLNNLGFKPNISVVDLNEIFGEDFSKSIVTLTLEKYNEDKTDYEKKDNYNNSLTSSYIFSDISATIKSGNNNILWLRDFNLKQNLTDEISKISLYKKESDYSVFGSYLGQKSTFVKDISFRSNENGLYEFSEKINSQVILITLKSGEQILLDDIYNYFSSNNNYNYITTSKPLYKPGEKVEIKVVSRNLTAIGFEKISNSQKVLIRDSRYNEVYNNTHNFDKNGSFEISFDIKEDMPVGNYTINVGGDSYSFLVEEYETPDFKIETKTTKDYYNIKDKVIFSIKADYYIGMPVSNGEGSYTLTSTDFYFDGGKTIGYHFGKERKWWWGGGEQNNSSSFRQTGNFITNDEGKTVLSLDLDKEATEDKIYTLQANVIDPNTKKSISSSTSFKGIRSDIFLGIKFDNYYYSFKDTAKIGFVATDIVGDKIPNTQFNFKVYKVDYEFDDITYTTTTKEKLVKEEVLKTNSSGIIDTEFRFDEYGEYRFEIETISGIYKTTKTIYVSGGNILRPNGMENKIEVSSSLDIYDVGDQAEIIISSPVSGVKALFTVEKLDKILYSEIIDIDSFTTKKLVNIKGEYLPNFDIGVYIIKDMGVGEDLFPAYYVGNKSIKVNLEEVELDIKLSLDKNNYKPQDKQVIDLEALDSDGNLVNSSIVLSIIDKSLLALKDNRTDILSYFYKDVPNYINTKGNIENIIKRIDTKELEEQIESYIQKERSLQKSTGGGMDDMLFSESMLASKGAIEGTEVVLRTEFRDLAFYTGKVEVVNGKAQITVPKLPDNLTTWVITGYGFDDDTKVSSFEEKFTVKKELNLIPLMPRFFVNGDKTQIGALISNTTNNDMNTNIELEISGFNIKDNKNINIKANSSESIYFDVDVDLGFTVDIKNIDVSLKAVSGNFSDGFRISRLIYPESTPEYVFTNGSTTDISFEEKLDFREVGINGGYIEISLGATILTQVLNSLDTFVSFPNDSLYSKLEFLKNYNALKEIFSQTGEIETFQNITLVDYNGDSYKIEQVYNLVEKELKDYMQTDGGFSYFKECYSFYNRDCSDFGLTGKYLSLGQDFEGIDTKKVLSYYKTKLQERIDDKNITPQIQEFIPLSIWNEKTFIQNNFNPDITKLNNQDKIDYINILEGVGISNDNLGEFYTQLKNDILIEARGSMLPANVGRAYGDNLKTTALMLKLVLKNDEKTNLLAENMARYLLSNRNDNGFYYTRNFTYILNALTSYINKTNELSNIDFKANAILNNQNIMTSNFGDDNKFDIETKIFDFDEYLNTSEINSLGFEKTGSGKLYYDVGVRYFLPTSDIQARDEGIMVNREYFSYNEYKGAFKTECIDFWWGRGYFCNKVKIKNISPKTTFKKGEKIVGKIEIIIDRDRTNVVVNDFLPAGAEILNTNFDTTSIDDLELSQQDNTSWRGFDHIEQRNNRVFLYTSYLRAGTYKYTYVLNATNTGEYKLKPAVSEMIDTPEIWGRSKGDVIVIE